MNDASWRDCIPELVTPPDSSLMVMTLDAIKTHLRADADVSIEDDLITMYLQAAMGHAEQVLNAKLVAQTWKYTYPYFPCHFFVPYWPLKSVDSLKYYDANGVLQTLVPTTDYVVKLARRTVELPPGSLSRYWPVAQTYNRDAVELTVTLGHDDPQEIRAEIKVAIAMLAAHFYANRESVVVGAGGLTTTEVPQSVDRLLFPFREIYF